MGAAYDAAGKFREALGVYKRSIKLDPSYPVAQNNLGVVYARLGQLDLAEKHITEAIKLDPTYEAAKRNLQRVLALKKRGRPG